MKATPAEQNELLRLQAVDTDLSRLDHAAANLPQDAELADLAPRLASVRQATVARSGELEDARTELRRLESDVEVVEARIERDSSRLQQTASVKDIHGLETELEALRKRRGDLEEIELTIMERVEELEAAIDAIEADGAGLRQQSDSLQAERAAELERIETRRMELNDDRAAIVFGLPDDLVALYEKQRARYGIGAALLQRGISLGSNTALNPSDLDVIRRAADDEVVLCPESNCILVRGEESGL